jgi:tetratricopeptide (TPR) repeat protein
LSKYPGLASTYISSGIVLSRLNDTISSREMLQKALSIDTTLHDRYAEFFCQMGRIPDAIGQIEKALDRGYRDLYSLKLNPDLRALQNEPRFRALLNHYFNL